MFDVERRFCVSLMQDRALSAFVVKERKSVSEKAATSKSAGRPRSRNTAAIIKAKGCGAAQSFH
jgi:hypothetical protein